MLEYVNAEILFTSHGARVTGVATSNSFVYLPGQPTMTPDITSVNGNTLVYFKSGQTPIFRVVPNNPADQPLVNAYLSGYLVDLTQ